MKIGLIGLPKSGKTTIFNTLTGSQAEVTAYAGGKAEPNLASVDVADDRVTRLSEIYKPKTTVFAKVDVTDFVGGAAGSGKTAALPQELLQLLRNNDAIAVVLRNFDSDIEGAPTPAVDLAGIDEEFILADMIIVENRLERIAKSAKAGKKTPVVELEEKLLLRLQEHLNEGEPLRKVELSTDEKKAVSGFQLLSLKPVMVVVNSGEDNFGQNEALITELGEKFPAVECAGTFEMELSQLDDEEEIAAFMADFGIAASARQRLTMTAYAVLGYISFFTVGADEVRAWNIVRGDTALDAAGAIHSDLARGFIRAECFSYDDFIECGSEKALKEQGKFRLEGRDYEVNDGDVLNIRFNV